MQKDSSIETVADLNSGNENSIGDVQLVNSVPEESNTEEENTLLDEEKNLNKQIDDYYANSKLERDKMYSQMIETYEKIINNSSISGEQKSIAITEIDKITKQKNSIMIVENLIKNKGFEDVLVLANEDSVSVVVKTEKLSSENVAQIQNIITKEMDIKASKMSITNKY